MISTRWTTVRPPARPSPLPWWRVATKNSNVELLLRGPTGQSHALGGPILSDPSSIKVARQPARRERHGEVNLFIINGRLILLVKNIMALHHPPRGLSTSQAGQSLPLVGLLPWQEKLLIDGCAISEIALSTSRPP